jgi:asparagine synthase (glutamine-hydrolysing)
MFAFALWDRERQVLLLGRDAAGKKPLYYYADDRLLVFGSEIKALLFHPGVPRRARPEVLPFVLAYGYAPTPLTCYEGILAVEPGQLLRVEAGRLQPRVREFGVQLTCTPGDDRPEAWTERLLDTLRESVRERLVSDVPIGAFLSGGVDSSLIVALMAELCGSRVRTFSIGFEGYGQWNEAPYARQVAQQFGTQHTEFHVDPPQIQELLPRIVWYHDQPFGDESSLPTLLLAELTRQHVTVALCGDAGDELFAGYERFLFAWNVDRGPWSKPLRRWPTLLAKYGCTLLGGDRWTPLGALARRGAHFCELLTAPLPGPYLWTLLCSPRPLIELLLEGRGEPHPWTCYEELLGRADPRDWLSRILDFNYRTYLLDDLLVKMDRMSMGASLEVRAPFLSDAMVKLAGEVPTGLKLRPGCTKFVLKEAARRYLPASIVDRPKRGFGVPLPLWWRQEPMRAYVREVLLDAGSHSRRFYRRGALEQLLSAEAKTPPWHARLVWSLLMIEHWHRLFLDGPQPVNPT